MFTIFMNWKPYNFFHGIIFGENPHLLAKTLRDLIGSVRLSLNNKQGKQCNVCWKLLKISQSRVCFSLFF